MLEHVQEWLSLLFRWFHVVMGAAWIGTSFYFNWLNNAVREPETPEEGVGGEVWSIHGGHYYKVLKYINAPPQLPAMLHWFKWESYLTWISGAALLAVVYYMGAESFLLDADSPFGPGATVGIGIGALVGGWIVYDLLCKSPLSKNRPAFAVVGFTLMVAVAFGLNEVMAPRAAYIHVGAMLGTMMAWNVFFVIIPGQRISVDFMEKGEVPDPKYGLRAALRSLHNNYITLPVLFIMVSSHYPSTYGHELNWAILAGIALAGMGVRHWFNLTDRGEKNVWILPVATALILGLFYATKAPERTPDAAASTQVSDLAALSIVNERCTPCHSANPTNPAFPAAPNGLMFDTPEQVQARRVDIVAQSVDSEIMPLGNLTGMTPEERALLGAWLAD
ncbi:MAG: urate hydroxylase PuuD [Proteobacteria bacterium]|nr:urate hydroxylase PuuD [Pseudomonadota bacterium]MCP4918330.1 urate hydroxylase PuuD [Pseudomonadota bacterium]